MTGSARILIVDDEAPIRRFLRVALEAEGYGVIEAGTARDGLTMVARESPALVVLDLGLPDADGVSLLRDLRGWSPIPVLILSVRADEPGKVEALDAGAQDYVVKPFGVKEFLARIRGLLRDRGTESVPSVLTVGPSGSTRPTIPWRWTASLSTLRAASSTCSGCWPAIAGVWSRRR